MPKLTKTALRRKKPVTDELLIPVDDEQRKLLEDAQSGLRNAEQGLALAQIAGGSDETAAEARVLAARTDLDKARDAVRKTGLSILLVSAGQERWNEVQLECPPTDEQKKVAEEKGEGEPLYDPKTFWPTLVAASVPDSDLTPDDWRREVFESPAWGPAEIQQLKDRTFDLYQASRIAELGN
jgi:hypothetical protein